MSAVERFFRQVIILIAVCFLSALGCSAQGVRPRPETTSRVDRYLSTLAREGRLSGAVLVARGGRVLLSKGYGMADMENAVKNSQRTKFRIGSITKQFTAAAIMMLQERGKLHTEDNICKYFTDCPEAWRQLSVRHLLTHTSGLWNYINSPDFTNTMMSPSPAPRILESIKKMPLEFAPGAQYRYSNSNYFLLANIAERVSGQPFNAFLQENIFAPLKMINTGADDASLVLKDRAAGYSRRADSIVNAGYIQPSAFFGSGNIYSTVEDLYLWDQALYAGTVISRKSLEEMFTPFRENYGYGFVIDRHFGLKRVWHGGGLNGFNSMFVRYPEIRATIIALSNTDFLDTVSVSGKVARLTFADKVTLPAEVKLEPGMLKEYAGRYDALSRNFTYDITVEGNQLFLEPQRGERRRLVPTSATTFYDDEAGDVRLAFNKGESGVTDFTLVDDQLSRTSARKVVLPPPSLEGNTTFRLKGHLKAKVVALAGSFNGWSQSTTLCAKMSSEWVCRLDLSPGKYQYKFVVDGNWIIDPGNPEVEDDGSGTINSVMTVPVK